MNTLRHVSQFLSGHGSGVSVSIAPVVLDLHPRSTRRLGRVHDGREWTISKEAQPVNRKKLSLIMEQMGAYVPGRLPGTTFRGLLDELVNGDKGVEVPSTSSMTVVEPPPQYQ